MINQAQMNEIQKRLIELREALGLDVNISISGHEQSPR